MTRSAEAFWVTRPGAGEIRQETLPERPPSHVVVQALYSGISRGTESIVFSGHVPASEHERMRCPHQAGSFPGPVKYGYASVGRVIDGPEPLLGRVGFCLHPHQTVYVVPSDEFLVLPDDVPPTRAVLAANLETALNAMWDAAPLVGDQITVVGAGVVGCLCAYLASRTAATNVEIVDIRPERAAIARAFGTGFAAPDRAARQRDLVFEASGTGDGLRTALFSCAPGGEVIELGWFGDASVSLPLGEAFHSQRLTLRSSQVGTLSPRARARFTRRDRLALALSMLRDPVLDVLFTGESPFESLPETMAVLGGSLPAAGDTLCHRIRYA